MPQSATVPRVIIPGYNHDIPYAGKLYHVQTEQTCRGDKCQIVTEVYQEGRVLGSHRANWAGHLDTDDDRQRLALQVRHQHKSAIKCILVGKLSLLECALSGDQEIESQAKSQESEDAPKPLWKPKLSRVKPHRSALQDLGTRRALIRFVRAVGSEPPQTPEGVRERLRSTVTSIAVLLNHEGEKRLRQDDVAELVMLRSDTGEYLREAPLDDGATGIDLWHGFAALAEVFAPVNNRATLRTHDLEALSRVLASWSRLEDQQQAPNAVSLELLKSCWGRDATIDGMLEDRRGLTVERLLPEVSRVIALLQEPLD